MKSLWYTAVGSFLLSFASAVLIDNFLRGRIVLLGDFAGIERSLNPGIAFGLTLPPLLQSFLILAALIVVSAMAVLHKRTQLEQVAFGLILGGGFANVVDRVRDGLVVDFIQVGSFPVFNVADSCITIGVAALLLSVLKPKKQGEK